MRVDQMGPKHGAKKSRKRVGRGIGGKGGKTAGRGTKGQYARNTVARGFEGGQMPLKQRVPKLKGFNNPFRVEYQAINLDTLDALGVSEITAEMLIAKGLIRKGNLVKVLGRGKVSKALSLSVHAVSQTAQEAITAAGGKITILPKPFRGVRPRARLRSGPAMSLSPLPPCRLPVSRSSLVRATARRSLVPPPRCPMSCCSTRSCHVR
ncbi:MAG: 50S ribosomal protein L15 [Actinobacteria bacterium]|nr:50S ribosomal protein L15 [Actinomycetota bacterium]